MITITIEQGKENKLAEITHHIVDTVKSWRAAGQANRQPLLLDESAARELGVSREKVEAILRERPWRDLGRYL